MTRNKAARNSGNYSRAKVCPDKHNQILADYERGTWLAGWVLFGMFALMALGSVMFGW